MELNEYQARAALTNEHSRRAAEAVFGLAGEVGSIQSLYKKRLRHLGKYPAFKQEILEELGDALWYLSSIATIENLSLDDIAKENLSKTTALFDEGSVHWFDKDYPPDEQFPRKFNVEFREKKVGEAIQVKISVNDVTVGDVLTDNAYGQDGYRYHDAFHLAYCAVLGWSPVVRSLLKRKRRSDRTVDEVEDGGRARVIEEAIANFVFNRAERENHYQNPDSISFGLVQTVQSLSNRLEVKACTAKQWQKAIHVGYRLFDSLVENGGGSISLDLDTMEAQFSILDAEDA